MPNCFYCGHPDATLPLQSTDSFDKSQCKAPFSDVMCDRCQSVMFGDLMMAWYQKEDKLSNLWTRNFSWLLRDRDLLSDQNYPRFGQPVTPPEGTKSRGSTKWRLVSELPTREQMRSWLLSPPEPPFEICIAVSGQKHTLFLSEPAISRDYFPVQLELEQVWVNRAEFTDAIAVFEGLMGLGFTKDEIESGNYSVTRLAPVLVQWRTLEDKIKSYRGSGLIRLMKHVAQKPELEATKEIPPIVSESVVGDVQLSLF